MLWSLEICSGILLSVSKSQEKDFLTLYVKLS